MITTAVALPTKTTLFAISATLHPRAWAASSEFLVLFSNSLISTGTPDEER